MNNQAKIEALLFIAGDEGITLGDLANLTGLLKPAVQGLLGEITEKYAQDETCALKLLVSADTYRLATKGELAPVVKDYFETPLTVPLTPALLEVLAIIAYRQPITRIEIDDLRGVQSSGSIQKLVVRGLVETKGRLNVPGRPFRYATTTAFLDYFGLADLSELPPLSEPAEEIMDSEQFAQALAQRRQKLEKAED
ncbi:MAG TPA: SMC-Scp complex subunit ScpB [Candidatus Limosilactobacillus faecipullorum]|nr:SMC-Scp complex subunit ScpB [Candidatus Limosilactobacillus faecipullorum]